MSKLVSVVIPAYKAEKYILQALESVRMQTYSNWEIIVVEDGYKDRTEEIVTEFVHATPEHAVRFIRHNVNQGLAATRNTAIQNAQGEYIAFLDHDDIWKEKYLEESVKTLEEYKADLVYSSMLIFDDETKAEIGTLGPTPEQIANFPRSLYFGNFIPTCSSVVKKASIEKIGLFDSKTRSLEDYECWIRMVRAGFKFVYIEGIYSEYRKHPVQLTKDIRTMVESEFYVISKHRDWDIISKMEKEKRLVCILDRVGGAWRKVAPLKALLFFARAWFLQPFNLYRAKRLLSVVKYGFKKVWLVLVG